MACYTAVVGTNADLIKCACDLYLQPGAKICDPTFGKGAFWSKVDLSRYEFHPSDLVTCPDAPHDFRNLPYTGSIFDLVTLDPPYVHMGRTPHLYEKNYRNGETTANHTHADIVNLYSAGMREAWRILKRGGLLYLKTQDEIESGHQRRTHIELYQIALDLGFKDQELFILVQKTKPWIQNKKQLHARKNNSFLWTLKKN
jgi:hypothetical protein